MKVITHISAEAIEGQLREPRGILNVAHLEPTPGIHVKAALGSAGLFLRRGEAAVAIPFEVLLRAAAEVCPELTNAAPLPQRVIDAGSPR